MKISILLAWLISHSYYIINIHHSGAITNQICDIILIFEKIDIPIVYDSSHLFSKYTNDPKQKLHRLLATERRERDEVATIEGANFRSKRVEWEELVHTFAEGPRFRARHNSRASSGPETILALYTLLLED